MHTCRHCHGDGETPPAAAETAAVETAAALVCDVGTETAVSGGDAETAVCETCWGVMETALAFLRSPPSPELSVLAGLDLHTEVHFAVALPAAVRQRLRPEALAELRRETRRRAAQSLASPGGGDGTGNALAERSRARVTLEIFADEDDESPPRKRQRRRQQETPRDWDSARRRSGFKWRARLRAETASLLLRGKYQKWCRDVAQTRWTSGGEQRPKTSLEEILKDKLQSVFGVSVVKLIGSGREDFDVRMLGDGRAFILEMVKPTKLFPASGIAEKLREAEELLQFTTRDLGVRFTHLTLEAPTFQDVSRTIKEFDAENKEERLKVYGMVVKSSRALTSACLETQPKLPHTLAQKTPLRVLHRRAWRVRQKTVFDLQFSPLTQHLHAVRLVASGGTYIKEFVHSDRGRTVPSLVDCVLKPGEHLQDCTFDILQLDVLGISDVKEPTADDDDGDD
eukprot:Gregarina_sp_Pseudo_9__5972@NODE_978_length_2010_cov_10_964992_g916_i0_p2_GENE_NODE_978_length_2010_cov_10_964992_g916_i0NODE_978_length_2010_cov_10_964992_g916_i0_p2_ORF_typecomplete_len455_score162_51ABC_trans_N/PF14510_6/0_73ABC_trans_N/PF14510_6/2e03AntiTRAP/PF15777_5/2_4_NODE_978_length_2010_cov_10_964992_g916_i02751639